jgi:hypothetical protein
MAVVQRGGERVLRSEPVVNRDDDAMYFPGESIA